MFICLQNRLMTTKRYYFYRRNCRCRMFDKINETIVRMSLNLVENLSFSYRSLLYETTRNRTSQKSTLEVTNKKQLLRSLLQKRRCHMSRTSRFIRRRNQNVRTMKIKQLSFIHRSRWESHIVIFEKISNVRLIVFFDELFVFARQTMSSSSCSKFWSCWRRRRSFWFCF